MERTTRTQSTRTLRPKCMKQCKVEGREIKGEQREGVERHSKGAQETEKESKRVRDHRSHFYSPNILKCTYRSRKSIFPSVHTSAPLIISDAPQVIFFSRKRVDGPSAVLRLCRTMLKKQKKQQQQPINKILECEVHLHSRSGSVSLFYPWGEGLKDYKD